MRRLVYTKAALADLVTIRDYITDTSGNARVALRFTGQIRAYCRKLASLPATTGRLRDDLLPEIRSIVFKDHVIFIRYEKEALRIVNIIEGHRDLETLLGDKRNDQG